MVDDPIPSPSSWVKKTIEENNRVLPLGLKKSVTQDRQDRHSARKKSLAVKPSFLRWNV